MLHRMKVVTYFVFVSMILGYKLTGHLDAKVYIPGPVMFIYTITSCYSVLTAQINVQCHDLTYTLLQEGCGQVHIQITG